MKIELEWIENWVKSRMDKIDKDYLVKRFWELIRKGRLTPRELQEKREIERKYGVR